MGFIGSIEEKTLKENVALLIYWKTPFSMEFDVPEWRDTFGSFAQSRRRTIYLLAAFCLHSMPPPPEPPPPPLQLPPPLDSPLPSEPPPPSVLLESRPPPESPPPLPPLPPRAGVHAHSVHEFNTDGNGNTCKHVT